MSMFDMDLDFTSGSLGEGEVTQESYNAGDSSYKDLFESKFNSFNPESIVIGGNGKLKSGMFALEVEDSDLAIGYNNDGAGTSPKPGRFM